jgi:hypothetical protein
MIAPTGPVAVPNRLGRLKMPAPTMEPTTIAVSENNVSFCCEPAISLTLSVKVSSQPSAWPKQTKRK